MFDEDGSYIEDKGSKARTPIHKRNGAYVMELKVKSEHEGTVAGLTEQTEQVFRRLGSDLI